MEMQPGGEVSLVADASPDRLYEIVSDVARTGEWSPECHRCEWLDGAPGPVVGARFRGWNRSGLARWSRTCEVVAAAPGREFAFRTVPGRGPAKDSTLWRFRFEPESTGTRLVQSYEIVQPPRWVMRKVLIPRLLRHHFDMRPHMRESLERIRSIAESTTARTAQARGGSTQPVAPPPEPAGDSRG